MGWYFLYGAIGLSVKSLGPGSHASRGDAYMRRSPQPSPDGLDANNESFINQGSFRGSTNSRSVGMLRLEGPDFPGSDPEGGCFLHACPWKHPRDMTRLQASCPIAAAHPRTFPEPCLKWSVGGTRCESETDADMGLED